MAYEPAPLPPDAERCDACGGTGWQGSDAPGGEWQECSQCLGTGNRDQRGPKQPMPDSPL
jgi:DnaJ-class molecular chaperone